MLQHVPAPLGRALSSIRAGRNGLAVNRPGFADRPRDVTASSPEFGAGGSLQASHTADGVGRSPALTWRAGSPAASVVLLVEDADSPSSHPLVHAIAYSLPPAGGLPAGALSDDGDELERGLNSYRQAGWLPPDPPTGHGPHAYVFQFFALDRTLSFAAPPGRSALLDAMDGHVLAVGELTGTYERPGDSGGWLPLAVGAGALALGVALWRRRSGR